jgi:L-alanine-DL-glutamate epimerase-like enolase superfamily enzyme
MTIAAATAEVRAIPLSRPYTITFRTVTAIEAVLVVLRDRDGHMGLGTASPEPHVTGETNEDCQRALAPGELEFLVGQDVAAGLADGSLARQLRQRMPAAPAARAAVDMALWDLHARAVGRPLCELLGRKHASLPTSITIGIKGTDEALAEADEYLGRGFRVLKVKIGRDFEADVERLRRLRERVGPDVLIRADANQGYTVDQTRRLLAEPALNLEFVEQPVPAARTRELGALSDRDRDRLCADEALLTPEDAAALVVPRHPCGIFNIKLMKCGGVSPALDIARVAEGGGVTLMWGCMDESCIGISAALHAALASAATRYLDLDGSFDLAHDLGSGGFAVRGGTLHTLDVPGLGVTLL